MSLSPAFMERLNEFAKLTPNWDSYGADVVSIVALREAERIAEASLAVAPEPFVAPCPDGEVLLRWTLPNKNHVEYFTCDEWGDEAALILTAGVEERRVADTNALIVLLQEAKG